MRLIIFVLGCLIMIAAPVIGLLPGPGGVFVFAVGLALVLRSSPWAKRRYVDFKRKRPKIGNLADWGLRRRSAKRRSEMAKRNDPVK